MNWYVVLPVNYKHTFFDSCLPLEQSPGILPCSPAPGLECPS